MFSTVFIVLSVLSVCVSAAGAYDIHVPRLNLRSQLQMSGFQGQSFSVQAQSGSVYNLISTETFSMNALTTDMTTGGACAEQGLTGCSSYPGTFITKIGMVIGNDEVIISSDSIKTGLTVSINGKPFTWQGMTTVVGAASSQNATIELVSESQIVITTPLFRIVINNRDYYLNLAVSLLSKQLLTSGRSINFALNDGSKYLNNIAASATPSSIAMHGLIGQTHRNVVYPNHNSNILGGQSYQGQINDYKINENTLTGVQFAFSQYQTPLAQH